jgi:hypothetical protein
MPPVALQPPQQEACSPRRRRKQACEAIVAPSPRPALRPASTIAPLAPAILRTPEAAAYIGLKSSTLEKARLAGTGVPYIQLTYRSVGYRLADLDKYLEQRRRQSTSEPPPAQQDGSRARGGNKDAARTKGARRRITHEP